MSPGIPFLQPLVVAIALDLLISREGVSCNTDYTPIVHHRIRRSASETTLSLELMCPPLQPPPCSPRRHIPQSDSAGPPPRVCPLCVQARRSGSQALLFTRPFSENASRTRTRRTSSLHAMNADCRPVIHRGSPHPATPVKAVCIAAKDVKQARQLVVVTRAWCTPAAPARFHRTSKAKESTHRQHLLPRGSAFEDFLHLRRAHPELYRLAYGKSNDPLRRVRALREALVLAQLGPLQDGRVVRFGPQAQTPCCACCGRREIEDVRVVVDEESVARSLLRSIPSAHGNRRFELVGKTVGERRPRTSSDRAETRNIDETTRPPITDRAWRGKPRAWEGGGQGRLTLMHSTSNVQRTSSAEPEVSPSWRGPMRARVTAL